MQTPRLGPAALWGSQKELPRVTSSARSVSVAQDCTSSTRSRPSPSSTTPELLQVQTGDISDQLLVVLALFGLNPITTLEPSGQK